jgi:hypothetical protein
MERHFDNWLMGHNAYNEGKDLNANPYNGAYCAHEEWAAWDNGWFAAEEDEQYRNSMEQYG